jgi:hypothetical protein
METDDILPKENAMSQPDISAATPHATDDPNEPVPMMQQLLDNPFLLLFLGVMVPMLVYTLWGVIDILTVPLAK